EADKSLRLLPQQHVDTGMGLERLVTVLQGKRSNYETDLFSPILEAISKVSGAPKYQGLLGEEDVGHIDMAYRVVADHIRTLCVCIADGVYPGMSGAEAVRFFIRVLKPPPQFLSSLGLRTVFSILGETFPELEREQRQVINILNDNEEAFLSSLHRGRRVIDRTLLQDEATKAFPGKFQLEEKMDVAWSLHRNLGFPLDLIGMMLEERGVSLDKLALELLATEEAERKTRNQQEEEEQTGLKLDVHCLADLQRGGIPCTNDSPKYDYTMATDGKYAFRPCSATVLMLYKDQSLHSQIDQGQRCGVILDQTCYYAEQGGQSSDQGYFIRENQQELLFPVESVQVAGGYVVHEVITPDVLRIGDKLQLFLDEAHRLACMANHTATHLLNFALRQVLGESAAQRGSHVTAERLRFDVSTMAPVSREQLYEVERVIKDRISQDQEVHTALVPLSTAKCVNGLRTVDEVYPNPVRVVSVGVSVDETLRKDFQRAMWTSVELCCGTHLLRTGAIQDVVIITERPLAKGITRLIAITREEAKQARETGLRLAEEVESVTERMKTKSLCLSKSLRLSKEVGILTDCVDSAIMPQWQRKELQKKLKSLQRAANTHVRKLELTQAAVTAHTLLDKHADPSLIVDVVSVDSLSLLVKVVNQVCEKSPGSSVLLLSKQDSGKVFCACQAPKEPRTDLSAAQWALVVCSTMGGNAGGTDIVAKGSGTSHNLDRALKAAVNFARANR
ncbi:hypothetical protein GDO86_018548, partial [Hymenochirus boettgeri]